MNFAQALDQLLKNEGGYVNNPSDPGGETNYGITVAEAKAHGYQGPMKDLTLDYAKYIYTNTYWTGAGYDKLAAVNEAVAVKLFNVAVNCGIRRVSGWAQTLLNVLNRNQKDFPDVQIDSAVGPATVSALSAYLKFRGKDGETVFLRGINDLQGAYYISIAQGNPKLEEFVHGWLLNRVQ